MRIQRNLHPAGRLNNVVFGLCATVDGLVRVFSFGFLHTTLTLDHARNTSRKAAIAKAEDKP